MEIPRPSDGDAPMVDAGPSSRPTRPVKEQEINEMNGEPKDRFLTSWDNFLYCKIGSTPHLILACWINR